MHITWIWQREIFENDSIVKYYADNFFDMAHPYIVNFLKFWHKNYFQGPFYKEKIQKIISICPAFVSS